MFSVLRWFSVSLPGRISLSHFAHGGACNLDQNLLKFSTIVLRICGERKGLKRDQETLELNGSERVMAKEARRQLISLVHSQRAFNQ
jgi:hypothetical protein